MKKVVLSNLVVAAIIFSAALTTSCDKDDETKAKEFTVTFESNGGSDVASQTVKDGEKVTKPSPDPTRSGYTFDAWYKETELTTEWKFDTDVVKSDVTLYAKWADDGNGNGEVYLLTEITHDNVLSEKFTYDDQNRIKTMTFYEDGEVYSVNTLNYNSSGDLTSMKTEYPSWGDTYTETYTKSGNKITIDDDGDVFTMELNDQGLPIKGTYEYASGDNWGTENSTFKYQGSNLTEISRTYESYWDGETYSDEDKTTFTSYDDKKAPFYHCKTPQWWLIFWFEGRYGIQNNPKIIKGMEKNENTHTVEYTYNADGFPVTAKWIWTWEFEWGEGGSDEYTETFIYHTPSTKSSVDVAFVRSTVGSEQPKRDVNKEKRQSFRHRFGNSVEYKRKK